MKSLSPNAQEFVPFKAPNVATKPIQSLQQPPPPPPQVILINNDKNAIPLQANYSNSIMHGYMPPPSTQVPPPPPPPHYVQYSASFDPQAAPVLAFKSLNDLNNYVYHQHNNQQSTGQTAYSVSPIRYAQALPIPPPIHVQSISPTQSISHDSMDKNSSTQLPHHMQASIIPMTQGSGVPPPGSSPANPAFYAVPTLIHQTNYIDPNAIILNNYPIMSNNSANSNTNTIQQPQMHNNHTQQVKRAFANSKTTILNKKNNQNRLNKQNIEINNDKEWPSLTPNDSTKSNRKPIANNTNKKVEQQQQQHHPNEDDEDDDDQENKQEPIEIQPRTPYLEDETKLKKLIKNVDFIKKTVEEHYNLNERKFSFKDAVLSKPVIIKPTLVKQQSLDKNNNNKENTPIQKKEEEKQQEATEETDGTKKKRKRNRRKNSLKKQETLTDENEEKKKEFDLNKEDFPDLAKSVENEKTNFQSDAYSSDATLEATNQKATTKTKLLEQQNPSSAGKKSSKPIIVEFANMISALEKGDYNSLKGNKQRSKSQINMPTTTNKVKEIRSLITNPLDSCPTQKRGKEREKPKQKKPSTLKKIILKEREEKRLLREQQTNLNGNPTNPLEIFDINIPASNLIVNSQSVLPNEEKTCLNASPKTETPKTEDENESDDDDNEDEEEEDEEEESDTEEQSNTKAVSSSDSTQKITNDSNNNNLATNASNPMSPISQGSPISLGGYTPTTYANLSMIANDRTLLSLEKLEEHVKQKIHNKKFREYCNQIINKEIDEVCSYLLHEIVRFQDRLYHKNPAKAKSKRRYVMGIREVTKHLKLHKLKCVILAPNCEKIQSKGGLDDAINLIIQTSIEQNVPFVFALGRKSLGKAVNKLVPISVVGIFDYSGAEGYFKRLVDLANTAKLAYQEIVEEYEKEECENLIIMQSNAVNNMPTEPTINAPLLPSTSAGIVPFLNTATTNNNTLITAPNTHYHHLTTQQIIQITHNPIIPSHMGHSRNSSTGSNISIEPFAYHMNYSHSRSASGNFNFSQTNTAPVHGHSRSASGGNSSILNIDFGSLNKHWTHSRTPSNCSNISFISRLSEPISEFGSVGTLLINNSNTNLTSFNSTSNSNLMAPFYLSNSNNNLTTQAQANPASLAAFQYYTEQVRQEMREQKQNDLPLDENNKPIENEQFQQQPPQQSSTQTVITKEDSNQTTNSINGVSSSLGNLHLGCINEIDAGNEADTEGDTEEKSKLANKSVTKTETSE